MGLLTSSFLKAQTLEPQPLLFAVNSPGAIPYLYFDSTSKSYEGLLVDFFAAHEQKNLFKIEYIDSNQLRSEQFVIDGKVDLYLASREWLKQPDKIISSIPVVKHKTFLYSLSPFNDDFSLEAMTNKRICTHQDFVYSGLQKSFADKKLQRIDSGSKVTMANMLAKDRCDYAILSSYNAASIFTAPEFCAYTIYQSAQPTSIVNLTINMRPELQHVKEKIDKQLLNFIEGGEVSKSILIHSPSLVFPKQAKCN